MLAPVGRLPRAAGDADPAVVAAFTGRARRMLAAAASASLLVGHLAARYRVTAQVRDLAVAGDLPVAVLPVAKGDFPESDPRFAGLYAGPDPYPSAKRARVAVEDADVLITVGVTLANTVLGGAHQLPEGRRIDLDPDQACIDGTVYPGIGLRQSLAILAAAVRSMLPRAAPGGPAAPRSRAGCPWRAAHPAQPVGPRAGPPAPRRPADRRPGPLLGAAGSPCPTGLSWSASRCGRRSAGPCRPRSARRWPRRTGASSSSPATAPCSRPRPSSAPCSARAWRRRHRAQQRRLHGRAGIHQRPPYRDPGLGLDRPARRRPSPPVTLRVATRTGLGPQCGQLPRRRGPPGPDRGRPGARTLRPCSRN